MTNNFRVYRSQSVTNFTRCNQLRNSMYFNNIIRRKCILFSLSHIFLSTEGNKVDSVYTNISKPFDSVSHTILIKQLKLMGISSPFLCQLSSQIFNRSQVANINGFLSNEIFVPLGISKGEHIYFIPFFTNSCTNGVSFVFNYA